VSSRFSLTGGFLCPAGKRLRQPVRAGELL
jgi:hypothetical protein